MSKKKKKDEIQSPFEDMKQSKEERVVYRDYLRMQNSHLNDYVPTAGWQVALQNAKYRIMYDGKTAANLRDEQGIGNNSPLEHMPAGLMLGHIVANGITLYQADLRKEQGVPMTPKEVINTHKNSTEYVMKTINDEDFIKPSEYEVYPDVNKKGDC